MKILYILPIILSLSTVLLSQTYFSERYNLSGNNSIDFCDEVLEIEQGYLIPGGFDTEESSAFNKLGILVIDTLGNKLSVKIYGDETYSYNYSYTQGGFRRVNNNYYSVGMKRKYTSNWTNDNGIIYKFDNNLDTIWTKTIGDQQFPNDTNYQFRHFDVLPNNDLIIAGNIIINGSTAKALLLKTDSLGNEQWRKYFYNGPLNFGINVIQTPDGGFAISCRLWTFGLYGIAAPYIVKTDSLGNEQWRHYVYWNDQKHGPMYLQNSSDSTIIGAYYYSDVIEYPATDSYNRDAILKIDLEGNVIWDKKFGGYELNKRLMSMNITDQGKIIVTGYTYSPFSHRVGYLLNCDNNGDSLWYREYDILKEYESNNYLMGVTPTSEGGYIAVGNVLPYPPDTGNQDVWVIKVDSMGCESWDECWTGVKEDIAMRKAEELKIYPNPASFTINIFIPKENESENHTLSIFDLYGRKVKETEVPSNTSTIQINVSAWKSGLYTVISGYKRNISGRGKFVIQ
ncbi:MAG: T9SS type A sorting domain-containing protein [Bacteroidales bacterium]|nr:T9SS type A sorting domain-containing protein [Bacteroidales bacterium]